MMKPWIVWMLLGSGWTGPLWAGDVCPPLARVAETAARARLAGVPLATLEANVAQLDAALGVRAAVRANTHAGYFFAGTPAAAGAAALQRCRAAQAEVAADLERMDRGEPPRDPLE